MVKKKAFISFDYDNDLDLKTMLVGQAKNPDTPFEIIDFSIKEAIAQDWKDKARQRIKASDVLIVICGENTNKAAGVSAELNIAKEEKKPYFLLCGKEGCIAPAAATAQDKIYKWTWDNLKLLIGGAR